MPHKAEDLVALVEQVKRGGAEKYHAEERRGGQAVRARADRACCSTTTARLRRGRRCSPTPPTADLPADGVVTGIGTRRTAAPVAIMANDSTVKAGSWGARTVEKIVRIQETAGRLRRAALLPGRLGRRAHHRSDRHVPGPPPRRAHLPQPGAACRARCRRSACCSARRRPAARTSRRSATSSSWSTSNASMYLGSPRMAEMVIGEKVTLEEMGGARMHCEVSGCGDLLAKNEAELHRRARATTSPTCRSARASAPPDGRAAAATRRRQAHRRDHARQREPGRSTCSRSSTRSSTRAASSRSRSCSRARSSPASRASTARAVGIVANQPKWKGGVLFVDSADKAARFIWLCDAFERPAAVPGRRARLHDRQGGRARRASSATAPR